MIVRTKIDMHARSSRWNSVTICLVLMSYSRDMRMRVISHKIDRHNFIGVAPICWSVGKCSPWDKINVVLNSSNGRQATRDIIRKDNLKIPQKRNNRRI
ncbi:hypothetical protein CR513_42283, partial [Mucuna pruriens]